MKITDSHRVPREGYNYTQPETNTTFKKHTFGLLVAAVKEHRKANNLPIPLDFKKEIENDFCERYPDLCTVEESDKPPNLIQQIAGAGKELWKWGKSGFKVVSTEEYDSRSALCLACPHWKGWQESGIGLCKKCGCVAGKISLKLVMGTTKCPIGKW